MPRARTAFLLLLLAGGLGACPESAQSPQLREEHPPPGRVLLIGIDGASPRIIEPMLEEGRLPNLARIAERGVYGHLLSAKPIYSPRIWNTIVTGKVPKKHGITSFTHKVNERNHLYLSTDRRTHALWNIASAAGLSVGVINFWNTYPPEKIRGVMISDHFAPRQVKGRQTISRAEDPPEGPVIFPPEWTERARSIALERPDPPASALIPRPRQVPRWVSLRKLRSYYREDYMLARIAREIDATLKPDLLLVLLTGTDPMSHWLWGNLEPASLYPERLRPTDAAREAGAETLRGYYAFTDRLIGELMAGFTPEDLVMVVSDHGFEAGVKFRTLTGVHSSAQALNGVIFASGRDIPSGQSAGRMGIADVTPTILTWLGLPSGRDMDGRTAPFLQRAPPPPIPTHDTAKIERLDLAASGVEDEMIDQLKGLGYID